MRTMKKIVSLALVLCTLLALVVVPVAALPGTIEKAETLPSWDNGTDKIATGVSYSYPANFPIRYVYYSKSSHDRDLISGTTNKVPAGFYDGVKGNDGYYYYDPAVNSGIEANQITGMKWGGTAIIPAMHWIPGLAFTAPYNGTITFTVQTKGYNSCKSTDGILSTFVTTEGSGFAMGFGGVSATQTGVAHLEKLKTVNKDNGGESGSQNLDYDQLRTFNVTLNVKAGQDVYFLVDGGTNISWDAVYLWVQKAVYTNVEYPTTWDNGDLTFSWDSASNVGYTYPVGTPIRYVYFNESSHAEDNGADGNRVPQGYYDMVYDVPDGKWYNDSTINKQLGRQFDVRGVQFAGRMHWLPGLAFTAPYTGTIKFTIQAAALQARSDDGYLSIVTVLEGSGFTSSDWHGAKEGQVGVTDVEMLKSVLGTNPLGTHTYTVTVDVTKGQDVYFLVDGAGNQSFDEASLYLKKAEYVYGDLTTNATNMLGVQETAPVNNLMSVRFLSSINALNYDKAGFEISAVVTKTSDSSAIGTISTQKIESKNAYTSVTAAGDGSTAIAVEARQDTYMLAMVMKNIPAVDITLVFTVKPYTTEGSETVYGTAYTVTYVDGEFVSMVPVA